MARRVLVVDDDPQQRAAFVGILAKAGYAVSQAGGAGDALRRVLQEPPDLVVLDLRLPDAHGVELAGAIRAVAPTHRMPIVVVTAFTEEATALDPKRFDASCVLAKPVADAALRDAVRRCLTAPVEDEASREL